MQAAEFNRSFLKELHVTASIRSPYIVHIMGYFYRVPLCLSL